MQKQKDVWQHVALGLIPAEVALTVAGGLQVVVWADPRGSRVVGVSCLPVQY